MQNLSNLKIAIIFSIIVLAVSFSMVAYATNIEKDDFKKSDESRSVTMKFNGNFIVSGVVVNSVSTSTNTLNVKFYGFNHDVNVSGAKIIGGGQRITLDDFKPGDVLSGKGNFNENTRVIVVSKINNLSFRGRATSSIQARIQELLNLIRQLEEKLKKIGQ
ncbi:MAG: hypothetical protein AB1643_01330 [Patescibacteria group bacterium]